MRVGKSYEVTIHISNTYRPKEQIVREIEVELNDILNSDVVNVLKIEEVDNAHNN